MIFRIIEESYRVAWSDLCYLKSNILSVMVTILMMPLLYFATFAFGIGQIADDINGVSYVAFVIPGIVALTTVTSSFSSTANKIMVQRIYYNSFEELLLCPISPSAIVLGKTTVGFCKGVLGSLAILIPGLLMATDLLITPMLIVTILLSCLTFSLLGVLAGFVVKGLPTMNMFNNLVMLPMTFLCGTLFSIESYPPVLQTVIEILPLTHVTACVRSAALGWEFPIISFVVVILFCIAFYVGAYVLLIKGRAVS